MKPPSACEWDWVVPFSGSLLHHPADLADPAALEDGEQSMAVLSCGRTIRVWVPGMFTRLGADRCRACCKALGYPDGTGSPINDAACRPLVEARVQQQYDIEEASDGGQ